MPPIAPSDRLGNIALARTLGRAIPQADGADRMLDDDVAAMLAPFMSIDRVLPPKHDGRRAPRSDLRFDTR